jgi:hypothetical protein
MVGSSLSGVSLIATFSLNVDKYLL